MEEVTVELRRLIDEGVKLNLAEGILFSAGLDTAILAFESLKYGKLKAFTVAFEDLSLDLPYAKKLSNYLGLEHHVAQLNEEELFKTIPEVVGVLKTFDPMEVRNSIAIHAGLKFAKKHGLGNVMSGDGADELFFGYSYLFGMSEEELKQYSLHLYEHMWFSSIELGKAIGINVKTPYLTKNLKNFASQIPPSLKIRNNIGKWILRKAYENILPKEFVWREKTAIEYGTGTTRLTQLIESRISDEEFKEKKSVYGKEKVKIRDKEQLYYYEVYRALKIKPPTKGDKTCPQCNSALPYNVKYCRTCGAYPV